MREYWVNVWQKKNGTQQTSVTKFYSRDAARYSAAINGRVSNARVVGRWKITLKEAPRDGR